ncbi:MAG: Gfo/Idh/MocA family protein [Phycisphaerales bacterium JB040]
MTDHPTDASAPQTVRVGICGLGFMGRTHLDAYTAAIADGHDARLVAVADADPDRRAGIPSSAGNIGESSGERLFDPERVTGYERPENLFADDGVDLVSLCTPTDTHVPLATAALKAGRHVLLEKPVALTEAEVRTLAELARSNGLICIPAMCMRFWPAWSWLKTAIADGRYGPVRAARFERLGSAPAWNHAFYNDPARSGGALFDFHIHDADFIVHCFGPPGAVTTTGTRNHPATVYTYPDGPATVSAEAGWLSSPHFPFRMRYTVEFESAVADFDLARDPALLVHTRHETERPDLPGLTGYDLEIRNAIEAVRAGTQPSPTLDDAALVTRVLEAEARSLESKRTVTL